MSVFKQFLAKDVIVTPFEVNKRFYFEGASNFTGSLADKDYPVGEDLSIGINRYLAQSGSETYPFFDSSSYFTSGDEKKLFDYLVWSSVKQLYYTNFLTSSRGDEAPQTIIVDGVIESGSLRQPFFENYLQTTLTQSRYFPPLDPSFTVISIPSKLYGDRIQPNSFSYVAESGSIYDDGEGNVYDETGYIGIIIYSHGLIVLPSAEKENGANYLETPNITCSFSSSTTLYETQYKCTIRENEFNYTLNPSLISGSDGTPYQYTTGSFFAPYITTVGLYNDEQELLAIAKFAQPIPTSRTTDMNLIINLDR